MLEQPEATQQVPSAQKKKRSSKVRSKKSTKNKATFKSGKASQEQSQEKLSDLVIDDDYEPTNCKDPQCKQRQPHSHNFDGCVRHDFCKVEDFMPVEDIKERAPVPFPMVNLRGTGVQDDFKNNQQEADFKNQLKQYAEVVAGHRKGPKLADLGQKVVVSDYAMAHWFCQIFKLDINNLTSTNPKHMTTENYKVVKSVIGKFVNEMHKDPEPEQSLYKSNFYEQYMKKFVGKPPPAPQIKEDTERANEFNQTSKNMKESYLDPKETENYMKRFQPLVYHVDKQVSPAKVLGLKSRLKQEEPKEQNQDLTGIEPNFHKITTLPVKTQKQLSGKAGQTRRLTTSQEEKTIKTADSFNIKPVKRLQGIIPISEDNESDASPIGLNQPNFDQPPTLASSMSSPASKAFTNMNQEKRVTINEIQNSLSGVTTPQKLHKKPQTVDHTTKRRVYNPKTSEQVKFFFSHHEQQALEKKMRNLFIQNQMKDQNDQSKERKQKLEKRFAKIDWNELHTSLIEHVIENERKANEESARRPSAELSAPVQLQKIKFQTVKDKQNAPSLMRQSIESEPGKRAISGPSERMLRLNKAIQQQRVGVRSACQKDISMRARRQQLFKETLDVDFNINVRQGRTYSKQFNKQIEEGQKAEGTMFQYLDQYKTVKERVMQANYENRYGAEVNSYLDRPMTQTSGIEKRSRIPNQAFNPNAGPFGVSFDKRKQHSTNENLVQKLLRSRGPKNYNQDQQLATIIQKKHTSRGRSHNTQSQMISDRAKHQSQDRRSTHKFFSTQSDLRDTDLRGGNYSTQQRNTIMGQSRIDTQLTMANTEENTVMQNYRQSKSGHRVNNASFMNVQTSMMDSIKPQSKLESYFQTKESSIVQSPIKKNTETVYLSVQEDPVEAYQQQTVMQSDQKSASASKLPQPENIHLEPNQTDDALKDQKQAKYAVSPEEYNNEIREPKTYFQPELNVELSLYEPERKKQSQQNDKDIFKSAEFWLNQGHQKCQKKALNVGPDKHSVALDYYLSGVKIDPEHYGCIYNTGCCHFLTGKYMNARKWFNLCIKVNPQCPDGYFGKAMACLKLGIQGDTSHYLEALNAIEKIYINDDQEVVYESSQASKVHGSSVSNMEESHHYNQDQITFAYAMACKILEQNEQSLALYAKLDQQIKIQQSIRMKREVFSVVLISLQKDRKVSENILSRFAREVTLINPSDSYDDHFTRDFHQIQSDLTGVAQRKYMARYFSKLPLFRRLSASKLEKEYIPQMIFEEKIKDDIIVLPDDRTVYIVLNGKAVLREHKIGNPCNFELVQVVREGQVLGDPDLDMGKSTLPFVWSVVYSQKIQLARMDLSVFRRMWQDTRDREREVSLSHLNMNQFFKMVSRQTLFDVMYEKCFAVRFEPGQLVMPIHSRSPWNIEVFKMYQTAQEQVFEVDQSKVNITQNQLQKNKKTQMQEWAKIQQQKMLKTQENSEEGEEKDIKSSNRSKKIVRDQQSDYFNKFQYSNTLKSKSKQLMQLEKNMKSKTELKKPLAQGSRPMGKQQISSTVSEENNYDSETEGAVDKETRPTRPIMIIRKGNAELRNTCKEQLQAECDKTMKFRNIAQEQARIKPKSQLLQEKENAKHIEITRLVPGTVFGESDCLQIVGFEFLGDIYAGNAGLECLVIPNPDKVLQEYEKQILQSCLKNQHMRLISMAETQNKILGMCPLRNF